MSWEIREKLHLVSAELPVEILGKIDLAVEFLQDSGNEHATRSHVVEYIIDSQLNSSAKAFKTFRNWKKEK